MALTMPHFCFTADQYVQMIEVGILTKYHKVELIHGDIVALTKITAPDASAVMMLNDVLRPQLPEGVRIGVRMPLRVADDSIPQLDMALIRDARYWKAYPTARDTFVAIEVADMTPEFDREVKLPLYATAGIPEAWLVDIAANRIERHTEPAKDGYQLIRHFGCGAVVESVAVPSLVIPVDEILGSDE